MTRTGIEQHGRAAGEVKNSPVGCSLVRGVTVRECLPGTQHPECVSFFICDPYGNRTARPSRRRGKEQPGGLFFSARGNRTGMSTGGAAPRMCELFYFVTRTGIEPRISLFEKTKIHPCCCRKSDRRSGGGSFLCGITVLPAEWTGWLSGRGGGFRPRQRSRRRAVQIQRPRSPHPGGRADCAAPDTPVLRFAAAHR